MKSQTIFLTWWCNIACGHCAFRSSPRRERHVIDEGLARRVLDAAARRGAQLACFTGGEVFAFFDTLERLMTHAHGAGMRSEVVTNCFWATSPAAATERLSRLRHAGLANLMVSYDSFHAAQLPGPVVRTAVHAALALDLHVHVRVVRPRSGDPSDEQVITDLALPRDRIGDEGAQIRLVGTDVLLSGAAADTLAPIDVRRSRASALAYVPCDSVIANPTLSPTGELYACCGLGAATDHGPAQVARIGSAAETPAEELYDRMERNLLLNLIHSVGTVTVIDMARGYAGGAPIRNAFSNNCDACGELALNPALRGAVDALLQDLHAGREPQGVEASR